MAQTFHDRIGCGWVPARSGKTFRNLNPATGEVLVGFPVPGLEGGAAAVAATSTALRSWRLVPAPGRAPVPFAAGEILRARKREGAEAMSREKGKVPGDRTGVWRRTSSTPGTRCSTSSTEGRASTWISAAACSGPRSTTPSGRGPR